MKHYLIVGGSKGIGLAILKTLINENRVINFSRTKPPLENTNLTHYNLDVLNDSLPQIDRLDGLVYCPGSINLKPFTNLSIEDFKADLEINLIGAVKTIQAYNQALKSTSTASIVLFSSVATKLGMPYHCSVGASKAAVEGFVKSLGAELAPTIRVNAIAPTITDTALASRLLRNSKTKQAMEERHPLKKILNPEEVSSLATYLLSEQASGITGQIMAVDCGLISFKL